MKKTAGMIAAALLLATTAWAVEADPRYNCDCQPSCEVAPGIYGSMESPVTSKFKLSIGGFARLDYAYNSFDNGNWGAISPSGPIPAAGTVAQHGEQSILTARQSRIWLKSTGPTFLGAKTGALIEADFYGDPSAPQESPQFRMRQAYLTMDWANTQLLFGQAWDTFGPAIADTVDVRNGTPNGTPNQQRVPQVRVTRKIPFNADNGLKLLFAVQDPSQDGNNAQNIQLSGTKSSPISIVGLTTSGAAVNVASQINFETKALGAAPGFLGIGMKPLTIGFFGLAGSQKTNTALTGVQVHTPVGHAIDVYGYGLYAFVPLLKSSDGKCRAMTASLEAQGYISAGLNTLGANASKFSATSATATAAKGYGFFGQTRFYPIQDLGITAGYGRRNALNYVANAAPGDELYNDLIFGNINYDLNAAIRLATEYEHLRTQYSGIPSGAKGDSGQANIIRFAATYFF
jgi:hypothetical protein